VTLKMILTAPIYAALVIVCLPFILFVWTFEYVSSGLLEWHERLP
jgi:hypothetical protein